MNTSTPERRDQVGAFFAANATRLHNSVRAAAHAQDACQTARAILLRRSDITLDKQGRVRPSAGQAAGAWK